MFVKPCMTICFCLEPAKVMAFEKLFLALRFIERNIMYPVVFLCAVTTSAPHIVCKFKNL